MLNVGRVASLPLPTTPTQEGEPELMPTVGNLFAKTKKNMKQRWEALSILFCLTTGSVSLPPGMTPKQQTKKRQC